ncbi:unnamed protein product, partial [marine sediment metagenome]
MIMETMDTDYVQMSSESEAKEYGSQTGYWIVANVRQQIGWPEKRVLVEFRGEQILLLPEEKDLCPCVAVRKKGEHSDDTVRKLIMNFLSSLAWTNVRAVEIAGWTGGSHPFRMTKASICSTIAPGFRVTYLPDPVN